MGVLFILCNPRQRVSLLDEFADWKEEGAQIFLSSITDKTKDGFILLEWSKPIPERFVQKLREDSDIIDFVQLGSIATSQP